MLDDFTVDGDNATDSFVVDLAWTAVGEEYVQVFNGRGEHSVQHMRDATVDSTVELNGTELTLTLVDAVMANFNAVVMDLP